MCLLEEIRHEIIPHDARKELLANALRNKKRANIQQLQLIEGIRKSSSAIPVNLVKSLSKSKIECQNLWRLTITEITNLEKLKECFTNLIKLTREAASIKSQQLMRSNYVSLLADYDFNITEKNIKKIFSKLGKFFNKNVGKVTQQQNKDKVTNIQKVTVQRQIELDSLFLQQMSVTPNEISISYYDPIDYDESDLCYGLFLLLRYSGYAIYQKCLAQNSIKSSITKHIRYETQELFMERIIGTSREFIEFIQPHIKEKLSTKGKINGSVKIFVFDFQ